MISILLVDDEPVLLDVMTRFLDKNPQYSTIAVSSGEEAIQVLSREPVDIILSDYAMPEMNGLELLDSIRKSGIDTPFIIFTGKGGEEIAIQALNSGADFYLQKGGDPKVQFTELSHMIERSVEAKRGIQILKENETKFRNFFNSASDAILILNQDEIIDMNKQASVLFGLTEEKVLLRSIFDFSPPEQMDGVNSHDRMVDLLKKGYSGVTTIFPWQFISSEGIIRFTEVSMVTIQVRNMTYLHTIIRDITQRMEEEERKRANELRLESMLTLYRMIGYPLKEITDFALESIVAITKSEFGFLGFISSNSDKMEIYSWSAEAGKKILLSQIPYSYDIHRYPDLIQKGYLKESIIHNEVSDSTLQMVSIPSEAFLLSRIMTIPVLDSGKTVLFSGLYNRKKPYDNENEKQCTLLLSGLWGIIRRKRNEEELRTKNTELSAAYQEISKTQEELNSLVKKFAHITGSTDETEPCLKMVADDLPAYITIRDESGTIRYANKYWQKEMETHDNLHASWSLLITKKERKKIETLFKDHYGKIKPFSIKYHFTNHDGKKIKLYANMVPKYDDEKKFFGYIECALILDNNK